MSWGWLLNGRVWAGIALTAALAGALFTAYSLGGAADRVELANLRASHAEQGRVAALARAKETEERRREDAARQDQQDKEARDGQQRIDAAVAAAGRAGAAEQRVRGEFAAFRAAVRRSAEGAEAAAPGSPAAAAAGVHADLLGELGARTERLGQLARIYAGAADRAYARGVTCERSGDAMSAPAVSLLPLGEGFRKIPQATSSDRQEAYSMARAQRAALAISVSDLERGPKPRKGHWP